METGEEKELQGTVSETLEALEKLKAEQIRWESEKARLEGEVLTVKQAAEQQKVQIEQ